MTGCTSFGMPVKVSVPPPANAAQPCKLLPVVPDAMDMGDLVQFNLDTMAVYKDCAERHQALIDATRQ